jgi:hypothetical protein
MRILVLDDDARDAELITHASGRSIVTRTS